MTTVSVLLTGAKKKKKKKNHLTLRFNSKLYVSLQKALLGDATHSTLHPPLTFQNEIPSSIVAIK